MLKDFLNALVVEAENTAECRIGRLIKELDSETAEAFKSAMRSKASSRSIWEALRRSDISVDRAAIDKGRKCFREQQDCSCGMGSNNG